MDKEKRSERIHMLATPSEMAAIDDVRFNRRLDSRADAIRMLMAMGLKALASGSAADGRPS